MSRVHVLLFAAVAVAGCDAPTDTQSSANELATASDVVVTLDKATYTWEEAQMQGIRGTIKNVASSPVYSKVGDAFNGSIEQDLLLIALGSDGAVERRTGENVWDRAETAVAVEGTRLVLLRPGHEYQFIAHVSGTPRPGTYRIGLTYRSTMNDEERAITGTGYSTGFDVR